MEIISYNDVLNSMGADRAHLLLGNGFSISCDEIFSYVSLYEKAVKNGLSKNAIKLFEKLGTNNFEGVMRLLLDSDMVTKIYSLVNIENDSLLLKDLEIIKESLIKTIANSHLEYPSLISEEKFSTASSFLSTYHNIFTTNYDLLLHWVNMQMGGEHKPPPFEDCFRSDSDDYEAEYLVFSEHTGDKKGIFYIHGALHLYIMNGEICKHSWKRSGKSLLDLVKTGLLENKFPLFVSEGTHEKKYQQIQSNSYLAYCYSKFGRITNNLVIMGQSLSENDFHILKKIASNKTIKKIFIGVRGVPKGSKELHYLGIEEFLKTNSKNRKLEIFFYDTNTVKIWS